MTQDPATDERGRILAYWWVVELFSPQSIPKPTRRAIRPDDRQVVEWSGNHQPLPWEELPAPPPLHGTPRVWRHTAYLGAYALEDTYESLHRVFADDKDAYDERPGGTSACAGVLIDHSGRLVADSAVLSSALWAVARAHDPGPGDARWMEGFHIAHQEFGTAVDEFEGRRRDAAGEELPPAHDAESLGELLRIAQRTAGIAGFERLATDRVIVESVAVSARRADEHAETDFLNSFYLDDLAAVRRQVALGDVGAALAAYLTGDTALRTGGRVDVVRRPDEVTARVSIERLPKGRWPANPEHSLALSQQFAVNETLNSLAPTAGILGVNGPPGTGKTTMLRDILAGNVVERARRLAALQNAEAAFTDTTHQWTAEGGHPRRVRQLRPDLTGFEMVVASANNAAVQNVTDEIPAAKAIDESWRGNADYFGDIATEILRSAMDLDGKVTKGPPPTAWGLVAARLGRKRNRSAFHSAFWFDQNDPVTHRPVEGGVPRMQTTLRQWSDGTRQHKSWAQARDDFLDAERKVDVLIRERCEALERIGRVPELTERLRVLGESIGRTADLLQRIDADLAHHLALERNAETGHAHAAQLHDRHLAARPGAWETIFTLGRAAREWRGALEPFATALTAAQTHHRTLAERGSQIRAHQHDAQQRLSALRHDLARDRAEYTSVVDSCRRDEQRFGKCYPGAGWIGDAREMNAPWLDTALDTARSELFLAALELHRDFLAATARTMLDGLRAAGEVVAGRYPHNLEPAKVQAAWQLFFLVVPLVSTTFASASRMFGDIGREAIGWLMIDEAGQASPQYAAGAIWRARRVVAVGDPMQLQPVVTIPQKAQRDIAQTYRVSATWIPPRASVQTLADRVATFGTTLKQGEQDVWVSAPLRVHRRCDEPMFTMCNDIAYNGIMVNGVHRDPYVGSEPPHPPIAASHWADEPATIPGTHLQPNQIERLKRAIDYLTGRGVPESDIIAISPFRAVADRLAALAAGDGGLRAGTIHTAQGREAPVVILVLGGDPSSPGAKAWAASAPNLVNVAASRAQRRLYVIGDRAAWAEHNYFRQLAAALDS
ncbi:MAG TPA: ATP-binding protein [Nakamurella sp.]